MNSNTVRSSRDREGPHVCIPIPVGDRNAFTHDATADILQILTDNPEKTFSNRDLHRLTGKGMGNVNGAVESLEELGVVTVDRDGRANQVQINPEKLVRSDDPITAIPQPEYHAPVRAVRDRIVDRIGDDAGIVLFGSVARGDADRASDIDVFVIIEDGRMNAQREAHGIEDDIASEQFDGDRYEAHIVVETRDSAVTHDRIRDVITEGITVHDTPVLDDVKREVFADEA
ncbi:nucleotidyltransferase domain-containing protein [Halobaculum magnesiiphilum]|uniref:Nucleotidyltransferase domain-containing protein n=1 Tax=Halobaculum magnesiiphilum TaxID=1017351 RepID=A0A8T8WED6_9EURY|nr:nucleotidyltransferase domain-containing protein [Halobaculum magnesiiphilum]QZP38220.1 nucleotidyltransferase domain-containing protein [Halobaculum magnesiiphilum]